VTWTKLGAEFADETLELSDAAFRTHVEALLYSNAGLLDLLVRKRDVRRFASTDDADTAVKELVDAGWWSDRGDAWYVGCRFPDWQRDRSQVLHRREQLALAQMRARRHKVDDHSFCLPTAKCMSTVDSTDDYGDDPERNGMERLTEGNEHYGAVSGGDTWP